MMPSSADLAYFIETAETLNISRAAERLGISQPSLSLALQRLEQAAGAGLFIRGKRGVALTQAGKQLLVHARRLAETWEEVRAGAIASMNEVQGSYAIGCHPSVALYLLSSFLPKLMKEHPKLDIRLHHDLSRKIAEGVISSKIDVGVVVNPVRHPDLVIHPLCRDEVTLWAAPGAAKNILICDPDLAQSQSLMKKIARSGMVFDRTVTSTSLEVIADLTAHGCGIGILPARVAGLARRKISRVPKAPLHEDEHCLIYRMENKKVKSIQTLAAAIRAAF